jgi:hypothetical protein
MAVFSVTPFLVPALLVSHTGTRCPSALLTLQCCAASEAGAPRKLNNVFCIPFGNLRSRSFASVIGIKRGAVDQFPYPRFQARHLQPAAVGLQVHRW